MLALPHCLVHLAVRLGLRIALTQSLHDMSVTSRAPQASGTARRLALRSPAQTLRRRRSLARASPMTRRRRPRRRWRHLAMAASCRPRTTEQAVVQRCDAVCSGLPYCHRVRHSDPGVCPNESRCI